MFGSLWSAATGLFSGLASKVMLGLIIALCVLSYFFYQSYERTQTKLNTAQTSLATLSASNDQLKQDYEKLKSSQKIDEGTHTQVIKETVYLEAKKSEVDKLVNQQVASIRKKYEAMEQTAENKKAEEREISTVQISGLWENFCQNQPQHKNCKKTEGGK